jgi:haloacetate dehalogenase
VTGSAIVGDLLDGFDHCPVDLDDVRINIRRAGSGRPLLLLHGYPQTMIMWRLIAPSLAEDFTVVLADLRGYGGSSKPAGDPEHLNYSKRVMARDMLTAMARLGHDRFAVIGHDRGARVAHRMALDAPDRVTAIAVLDIVPTRHMFTHVDRAMATSYFHWFFLTAGEGIAEKLINADPHAWIDSRFAGRRASGLAIEEAALSEYRRVFEDPSAVHATCEDYRAAAGPDLKLDQEDYDVGLRVRQPLLALWGANSYVGRNFDVPAVWRCYATDVSAQPINADHYLPEEAPHPTEAALRDFFADPAAPAVLT